MTTSIILELLPKLQATLARHDTPANRSNYQRFFKEKLGYGLLCSQDRAPEF